MPRIVVENRLPFSFFSDLQVLLDGRDQLKLGRNQVADFQSPPGIHVLQARSGDIFSEPLEFRAYDRETLGFACSASGVWQKSISIRTLYHRRPDDRFGGPIPPKTEAAPEPITKSDWATVLNVADTATMDEIRRAYLRLIWKYHPDRAANLAVDQRAAAEQAARAVNMAYTAAKKKRRRA
jgi:hypothetical protein